MNAEYKEFVHSLSSVGLAATIYSSEAECVLSLGNGCNEQLSVYSCLASKIPMIFEILLILNAIILGIEIISQKCPNLESRISKYKKHSACQIMLFLSVRKIFFFSSRLYLASVV